MSETFLVLAAHPKWNRTLEFNSDIYQTRSLSDTFLAAHPKWNRTIEFKQWHLLQTYLAARPKLNKTLDFKQWHLSETFLTTHPKWNNRTLEVKQWLQSETLLTTYPKWNNRTFDVKLTSVRNTSRRSPKMEQLLTQNATELWRKICDCCISPSSSNMTHLKINEYQRYTRHLAIYSCS